MTIGSTERLDRRKVYVIYCDGIGRKPSTKGADKLGSWGSAPKNCSAGSTGGGCRGK
jgi:hypothetical protein